eukprot:GHVL01010241.1.p1 GENE.GHVL01010241.1~~GHVL01010241.1.p1  ORF type:complete len:427 (-),score=71.41 GHVL01010241.1:1322-2602(-)
MSFKIAQPINNSGANPSCLECVWEAVCEPPVSYLNLFCACFDTNGNLIDVVYWSNPHMFSGGIRHEASDIDTGVKPQQTIVLNTDRLPPQCQYCVYGMRHAEGGTLQGIVSSSIVIQYKGVGCELYRLNQPAGSDKFAASTGMLTCILFRYKKQWYIKDISQWLHGFTMTSILPNMIQEVNKIKQEIIDDLAIQNSNKNEDWQDQRAFSKINQSRNQSKKQSSSHSPSRQGITGKNTAFMTENDLSDELLEIQSKQKIIEELEKKSTSLENQLHAMMEIGKNNQHSERHLRKSMAQCDNFKNQLNEAKSQLARTIGERNHLIALQEANEAEKDNLKLNVIKLEGELADLKASQSNAAGQQSFNNRYYTDLKVDRDRIEHQFNTAKNLTKTELFTAKAENERLREDIGRAKITIEHLHLFSPQFMEN